MLYLISVVENFFLLLFFRGGFHHFPCTPGDVVQVTQGVHKEDEVHGGNKEEEQEEVDNVGGFLRVKDGS